MSIGAFAWIIIDILPDWARGFGEPKLGVHQAKARFFERFLQLLLILPLLGIWFGGAVLMGCSLIPALRLHRETIAMTGASIACSGAFSLWFFAGPAFAFPYGITFAGISIWCLMALVKRS